MSKLTRALEELAKRADAGDQAAVEGIRAYHGSPYSFDEFSTSQIGTGEGAQAYGRGLYFAEREKTAEGYRKAGTGSRIKIDGEDLLSPKSRELAIKDQEYNNAVGFLSVYGDADQAMRAAVDNDLPEVADRIKSLVDSGRITTTGKGSMYEVNIAATPDEFIDWDLPLDEQSESVMNALNKTDWYQYAEEGAYNAAERRGDNAYGMDLVRWLEEDGAEDAAQMLKDAGIKGVQYADAQTRFGKGPKTKNYVVYDDKLIDITKKYGISIPAAAAVLAGTMTPEEAQAGPGSKALAELAKRADAGDEVARQGIRAYHGSPHSFDKFSTSQIGTGEGAQAYGHGLYFAESEDVAKGYRDDLTASRTGGAQRILQKSGGDVDAAIEAATKEVERLNSLNLTEATGASKRDSLVLLQQEKLSELTNFKRSGKMSKGSMYEVNIDATPDDFLDYDLPLSQQSDKVRSSVSGMLKSKGFDDSQIQAIIDRDIDGQELNAMLGSFDESKGVKHMTGQGIKGIRYKDGFSRGADGGSSNYVVFDDKLIDITKKYGVSIPAAAAIAAGTMTPEEAQASTPQDQQASEYPSLGGMGVRMPPAAEDEEAMLAPTGGDLMQQANRDFADSIRTQPEPDFLTGVQQSLLSGIMKTAGVADLSADVVSAMAGPLLSAPGAIARYAADRYVPGVNYSAEEMAQGRRETEDYFNYQPRTELGPQYGEQIMQGIGGAIAPYVPAIKKAAGDSYILGAMNQGYDYLGAKEKMFVEALGDIFSPI
jgi:hypothetical protein